MGAGLSASYRGTDQVCVCFFGDGSTNQGTFHESLNLAAIWKLPIIFVCENNHYGISMSQARHQAIKDIADRGAAYGIPGIAVDGNDVMAVHEAAAEAVARARKGQGPTLLECKTYRWRGHFEGDPAAYKPREEQEAWLKKDPLPRFTAFLTENNILTAGELAALDQQVQEELAEALYVEKSIISYYENDKKEMRASGLAEIAKVLQTTPNYLLGFADNNDGFVDEALGLLRDVKDQSVREILLKQIRALI